jgi:transketolase
LQALATRAHSQTMLNVLQPVLPGLIGGSADLAPSNLTIMKVCISASHAPLQCPQ